MKRIFGILTAVLAAVMFATFPALADTQSAPTLLAANTTPPVCWHLSENLLGSPSFDVKLTFQDYGRVQGKGKVTQVNPSSPEIKTELFGTYEVSPILLGGAPETIIQATGYPDLNLPSNAGIGPALFANTELHMVLGGRFNGPASYKYREGGGPFTEVNNASVQRVPCL